MPPTAPLIRSQRPAMAVDGTASTTTSAPVTASRLSSTASAPISAATVAARSGCRPLSTTEWPAA